MDFGPARQEFHIGFGSIATPGIVSGLFTVHRDIGTLPMDVIVAPAVSLAREGVEIQCFQATILEWLAVICLARAEGRAIFGDPDNQRVIARPGTRLRMSALADTFEALAREGEELFYKGDIAQRVARDCRDNGGHLGLDDFAAYTTLKRPPLMRHYRDLDIAINPPPSSGGVLIAFALDLLSRVDLSAHGFGSITQLALLARTMDQTNQARLVSEMHRLPEDRMAAHLLDPDHLATYAKAILSHPQARRGTTHISVVDGVGNTAALSTSNGEGSSYIVADTGIMLNNMLGEEDVNPHGFHDWPVNRRLASMMAPTILWRPDGLTITLGSGGSNRIRTAILQVLINLIDLDMEVGEAVRAPRIHVEEDRLDVEHGVEVAPGFSEATVKALCADFQRHKLWPARNMYFGGVHTVVANRAEAYFDGSGDPRRGGVAMLADGQPTPSLRR